jgi:hypothetical protein
MNTRYTLHYLLNNTWRNPEEYLFAIEFMMERGHNVAHFGVNDCFLFSERMEDNSNNMKQ